MLEEKIKAPFKDFKGNDISEGDKIVHPSGQSGIVKFYPDRDTDNNKWVLRYFDDAFESRLCLQIGDSGQGVVQ